VLGLFITGHPLTRHADRMRALTTTGSAGLQSLKDDAGVVVGGIVTNIKTHVTKRKQERMAFLSVEDMDGSFEVVVFADLFTKTCDLLQEDALVMIVGRVNYRDSEPKIVAEEIIPFEAAEEKLARSCHIRLMTAGLEESTLEELARIASENEGTCKLFLHLSGSQAREVIIESAAGKGLKPGALVKERIEDLTGEGSVWFSLRANAVSTAPDIGGRAA